MRLLILDHFFAHDIEALADAAGPGTSIRVMSSDELRAEALRIFPEEVAGGLEAFTRDEFAEHRRRFAVRLGELLAEEMSRGEFDAFVVPSDSFFYVRAAPEACRALGVSFFCVQKETTISPNTMVAHAEATRLHAPFIADHMVVCSERHKDFWVRAGTRPELIDVTGQPRFDLYRQPERWPARVDERPTVLFFSYMLDAYHPDEGSDEPVWDTLHRQTEAGLWELARRGWRILIKPHPQQPFGDLRNRLKRELGPLMGASVELIEGGVDARRLILASDVVVGFQSTALIESMAAGKPIVYTGWDPLAAQLEERLIPFHEWQGAIDVVTRPEELADTVAAARTRAFSAAESDWRDADRRGGAGADRRARRRARAGDPGRPRVRDGARRATPPWSERRAELARRRPPLALGRRTRRGVSAVRRRVGKALGR